MDACWGPEMDEKAWRLVAREAHLPDEKHAHAYTFLDYVRA